MNLRKLLIFIFLLIVLFTLYFFIKFEYTEHKVHSYLISVENKSDSELTLKKRLGNLPGDRNYLIEVKEKEKDVVNYYYYDYNHNKVKGEESLKNGISKELKTKPN